MAIYLITTFIGWALIIAAFTVTYYGNKKDTKIHIDDLNRRIRRLERIAQETRKEKDNDIIRD